MAYLDYTGLEYYDSKLRPYDDLMSVIAITDNTTTMGDLATTLSTVNTNEQHVVFDVSALNAGMYLCTIYINQGYYRIADLVTGFEGTGFYSANDLLYDVITSGSSTSGDHYTVCWDQTTATMTRLNAAASITTNTANFGHFGSVNADYDNPFDDIYPWSGRKLCNIDLDSYMALTSSDDITDCVTYWEDDTGFSYTDTYGVWVYTPPFYGRSYVSGNYRYFDVTEENTLYNHYYPAMITGRWHGAPVTLTIDSASKICNLPVSGALPLNRVTMTNQHTYAQNFGGTLTDIYTLDASLLLYVVEYANMNAQTAIGNGVSALYRQSSDLIKAAATSSTVVQIEYSSTILALCVAGAQFDIGTADGGVQIGSYIIQSAAQDTTDTTLINVTLNEAVTVTTSNYWSIHGLSNIADSDIGSMSGYIGTNGKCNAYYRGEVLWGNRYQYILGAYRQTDTSKIYIASEGDCNNYNALNTAYHTDTGLVLPASSSGSTTGYIGALGMCDGLSVPPFGTAVGGSSSAPVGDYLSVPATTAGNTVLFAGGRAAGGAADGPFYGNWLSAASGSYWYCGSRPRLINPS